LQDVRDAESAASAGAAPHWGKEVKPKNLFTLAEVQGGHAHRFRDTFAVELLLAGVPLERVSVLLGHQSVRITERHYSPWVRSRQAQLEQDLRRAWSQDPVALMQTKGTPEVHARTRRIN
jgi:integrase